MADIELPQLGESVTEGTITQWFKAIGDEVAEDEPLFEVSTDKVDSEVPSPVSGYLTEILVEEGDTVDVGTKVAVLSDAPAGGGDGDGSSEAPAAEATEPEKTETEKPEPEPEKTEPEPAPVEEAEPAPAQESPAPAPAAQQAPTPEPESGEAAPLLSPVVRRLLEEAGADASAVTGTGVGGRITRADVEAYLRDNQAPAAPASPPPAAPAPAAAPAAPSRPAPAPARLAAASAAAAPRPTGPATGTDVVVPLNRIRQATADHMVRSKATSAHVYVSTEVDYEAIERVRRASKDQFRAEEGVSLTYLPFVARALIDAIAEFPNVNASMGDDSSNLTVHGSVNLGIAVDLDFEGLIVPVVKGAQDQRLRAIARNVADLATRAKERQLTADDITGGTITITNVGSTGNLLLLPVISQPQVTIVSTDGVKRRPVVVTDADGNESIAIHSVGNVTVGWDHRAFDGAYAAQFLARVREILETRDWAGEL